MALFAGSASSALFGVSVLKDCITPVKVGDPYACEFEISNTVQTSQNTVTVTQLQDHVFAAVPPPDLILPINSSTPGLILAGGAACDPAKCTIPFGGSLTTSFISHYTVQLADFPAVADQGTFTWRNSCNVVAAGCNSSLDNQGQATAQADITPLQTTTVTAIHNAAHQTVTAVPVGSTVHDFVTVADVLPNEPTPTGNVNVDWLVNGDLSGTPQASSGAYVPLDAYGQFDATRFAFTVNPSGARSFRANYLGGGGGAFLPSQGACEPLQVVDANIQISPLQATNRVGTNHTLTGHVNVNSGAGFVNAPDGTLITFSIQSGPGVFVGGVNTCNTAGGTGSCTVQITSATTGTTVVRAATDVTVAGVSLHRATADGLPGDSADAHKDWVNARISIAPSATNEVGHAHTFTVTLQKDLGAGFVAAAGETVTVTCTASNGATPTPAGPFTGTTNASGQFQVTVNSPLPGKDTCHAASTLTIDGATITVETNGQNGNSGDAVKTWVDANIQLTPATATNPVGTNHTLHCHINVNDGSGGPFVNAPAGTVCTVAILSGPGTPATQNCSTVGATGSCDVVITSATPGTTTLQASTDVAVGGVTLHRATGDANVGDGPNAVKNWASARISIAPTATNEVGHAHTFTVTLQKDVGAGFVAAAGETVTVTCTASNGATPTPAGPFTGTTNASGQFQVTVNSPTPGKDTCHAASTLTIGSATFTVETDGSGLNSPDAVKTWVDANIQLTPATATNPVGTNHTLHCHINVNDGSGGPFVNAPAGTVCTVAILSGPGTPATQNCSTVGTTGSCDAVITSATPGTSTLQATTTVAVGGVSLTRTTGDANVGDGPNAVKNWASARISIAPSATNEVNHAHTFTVTLQKDTGAGFVAAAGETVTVTCTASNGATPTPAGPFTGTTNASGQFQVTVNSPLPGKDTC